MKYIKNPFIEPSNLPIVCVLNIVNNIQINLENSIKIFQLRPTLRPPARFYIKILASSLSHIITLGKYTLNTILFFNVVQLKR